MLPRLLLLSLLTAMAPASAAVKEGDVFPSPSAGGVEGKFPATKGKVVLYDFWASWCAPCRAALPGYEALFQKFRARGFEVVAIGTDADAGAAQKFVGKLRLSFPVVADVKQGFVTTVGPATMPTSYLVGKDGRVLSVHKGFHGQRTLAELSAAIEAALK